VNAHNDLVAVDIDMSLHEGHRLSEHIEACTHEVDAQDLVVANNAENALIVVARALREELDDDARLRVRLDDAFDPGEAEDIGAIVEELE
jgi:hypothetical protein